jgi:uncharacterized protein (DUF1697 family)
LTPIRYLALLRAVNVGGRTVKMERLRALFAELGFADVQTYIQSGNVFFSCAMADRAKLTLKIERHLAKSLGFEVPVFIRTLEELDAIARSAVFADRAPCEDERCCVTFTSKPAPAGFTGSHTAREDFDVLHATPGELYVVWRFINGRPGNPGAMIEKTLGAKTTTRFFHTLLKMRDAGIAGIAGIAGPPTGQRS